MGNRLVRTDLRHQGWSRSIWCTQYGHLSCELKLFLPQLSASEGEAANRLDHVNRLKFLKRQMYGRAGLDLLRVRVLHPN